VPIYTFYCCTPDGAAPSFEAYDLQDDQAAYAQAGIVLEQHASASHIDVYDKDRAVLTFHRIPPPVAARGALQPREA
jgi:hypothetical protein